MTMTRAEKSHEQRVRRMAERQMLTLSRSRSRDPMAWDYGTYSLTWRRAQLFEGISLAEAERSLSTGRAAELAREIEARREKSVTVAHAVAGSPGQTRPDVTRSDARSDARSDTTDRK